METKWRNGDIVQPVPNPGKGWGAGWGANLRQPVWNVLLSGAVRPPHLALSPATRPSGLPGALSPVRAPYRPLPSSTVSNEGTGWPSEAL